MLPTTMTGVLILLLISIRNMEMCSALFTSERSVSFLFPKHEELLLYHSLSLIPVDFVPVNSNYANRVSKCFLLLKSMFYLDHALFSINKTRMQQW